MHMHCIHILHKFIAFYFTVYFFSNSSGIHPLFMEIFTAIYFRSPFLILLICSKAEIFLCYINCELHFRSLRAFSVCKPLSDHLCSTHYNCNTCSSASALFSNLQLLENGSHLMWCNGINIQIEIIPYELISYVCTSQNVYNGQAVILFNYLIFSKSPSKLHLQSTLWKTSVYL